MSADALIRDNLYCYCWNDAVILSDEDGMLPSSIPHSTKDVGADRIIYFTSPDDAAVYFAETVYGRSSYVRFEFSASIHSTSVGGNTLYYLSPTITGHPHSVKVIVRSTNADPIVAYVHTHPNSPGFSSGDTGIADNNKVDAYVANPHLEVLRYDYTTKTVSLIQYFVPIPVPQSDKAVLESIFDNEWYEHISLICPFSYCQSGIWPTP